MSNLNNTCVSQTQYFFYGFPKAWDSSDIKAFSGIDDIHHLIESDVPSVLGVQQQARFPDCLDNLYLNFHKEIEMNTGVIFLPNIFADYANDITQLKKVFYKVCRFFGNPVPINKSKDVIREVKDIGGKDSINNPVRGHLTNQALAFHSDRADITALVCVSPATEGGEFKICSSAKLVRRLQQLRPDLLQVLSTPIPHDLRDEGSNDESVCNHPVISYQDVFWVRYIRKFIDSTVRHGIKIQPAIEQALDYVERIINEKDFSFQVNLKAGDAIIFNNHLTLHSRNAFKNSDSQTRCLLRVWLSSKHTRPLHESLKPIFHDVKAGSERGGIR